MYPKLTVHHISEDTPHFRVHQFELRKKSLSNIEVPYGLSLCNVCHTLDGFSSEKRVYPRVDCANQRIFH